MSKKTVHVVHGVGKTLEISTLEELSKFYTYSPNSINYKFLKDDLTEVSFDRAWEYLGGKIDYDERPSGLTDDIYKDQQGKIIFESPSHW